LGNPLPGGGLHQLILHRVEPIVPRFWIMRCLGFGALVGGE